MGILGDHGVKIRKRLSHKLHEIPENLEIGAEGGISNVLAVVYPGR